MLSQRDGDRRGSGLVSPFSLVDEIEAEMDDGLLRGVEGDVGPDIELSDEGHRFVLRMDAPGVSPRNVEILYDDGAVTLRIARDTSAPDDWRLLARERPSYRIERTFVSPVTLDVDGAEATLRDGVLTVALPKAPEAQPRRLPVRAPTSN